MKVTLSAYAVFELAMFGIMVLFLSFCGFFTFKHCFYIWRKKKRRRHEDSLESILDLLYNEDYYYLETSTPYLPEDDDSSNELPEQLSESVGNTNNDKACFDSAPSQGRSIKWSGPEKISYDKFKVCPQAVETEKRRMDSMNDDASKRKLKRQIKFQLSGSNENVVSQGRQSAVLASKSPSQDQEKLVCGEMPDKRYPNSSPEEKLKSPIECGKPSPKCEDDMEHRNYSKKQASVSIRKIVASSKFIGAAHRAKKQLRMQSRFPAGTFRYRSDANDEDSGSPHRSFDKKPLPSTSPRHHGKRKVKFMDLAGFPRHHSAHRHKHRNIPTSPEKRDRKFASPGSAFSLLPRRSASADGHSGSPHESRNQGAGDVEELCLEYEQLEKTQYEEMLKKAKSFRRENLPFFHRKHTPS